MMPAMSRYAIRVYAAMVMNARLFYEFVASGGVVMRHDGTSSQYSAMRGDVCYAACVVERRMRAATYAMSLRRQLRERMRSACAVCRAARHVLPHVYVPWAAATSPLRCRYKIFDIFAMIKFHAIFDTPRC